LRSSSGSSPDRIDSNGEPGISVFRDAAVVGAVIVSEVTHLPYTDHEFRRLWRMIARECGVPDNVFNMDSRSGAISEATNAGADLEHVRHAATHSNISMTQRYSRDSEKKIAGVMDRARGAGRRERIAKTMTDGMTD
jgi:flagellar biosynthesis regulator FlaF